MQRYRAWNSKTGEELPEVHAETAQAAAFIAASRQMTVVLSNNDDLVGADFTFHPDRVAVFIPTFGTVEYHVELA